MEERTLERLVRPRVVERASAGGEPTRIEDALEQRLARGARGTVRVVGPPGAGKRTALEYVRLWAAGREDVRVGGGPRGDRAALRVLAGAGPGDELELVPWGRDEWIEYLLARHRAQCAGVMARLARPEAELELRGRPLLWAAILDELARDPELSGAHAALRAAVRARFSTGAALARARRACWDLVAEPHAAHRLAPEFRAIARDEPLADPFLAQGCVQLLLAAEHLAGELDAGVECELPLRIGKPLLRAVKPLLCSRREPRAPLVRILAGRVSPAITDSWAGGPRGAQASAAALLHLCGPTALAEELRALAGATPPRLVGAELEGLEAPGVELVGARLDEAHLAGAHLDGADLRHARLSRADLARASLCGAKLAGALARRAELAGADLRGATLDEANISAAHLDEARFEGARLRRARLDGASLRRALLDRADLAGANLRGAVLEGASLREADLRGAALDGVDLRDTRLATALGHASLVGCNLEQQALDAPDLSGADLRDALLTGSRFRNADLRGATLAGAGLAHVSWPGANLRHADLAHASFHLGSSRSGLVLAAPAGWGTRTGFYSEELRDQAHRPPEELRKADLRHADLRGARIEETDFYLVDLRGARYTPEQGRHLRACGAIL